MSVNAEKMFTQHNCLAEGAGEWHSAQHGATAAPGYREKKREKYIQKNEGIFSKNSPIQPTKYVSKLNQNNRTIWHT